MLSDVLSKLATWMTELDTVGLQFKPYWWRPYGVTWDAVQVVNSHGIKAAANLRLKCGGMHTEQHRDRTGNWSREQSSNMLTFLVLLKHSLSCCTDSESVLTVLFFFRDFFWKSGLLESWILLFVLDIALTVLSILTRCETHPESWLHQEVYLSFVVHWPYPGLFSHNQCGCLNLKFDHLLPVSELGNRIPAFLPTIIKLVCHCVCVAAIMFSQNMKAPGLVLDYWYALVHMMCFLLRLLFMFLLTQWFYIQHYCM